MNVFYLGTNNKILSSVERSNFMLTNEEFYRLIGEHPDFDHTEESPANISGWIKDADIAVRVRLYDGDSDSRTNAYVSSKYPNTLFYNDGKLYRDLEDIVNTIIHECVHAVDAKVTGRFGHGGNSSRGKQNTAPYWIGSLAERILRGGNLKNKSALTEDMEYIEELEEIDESRILD